MLSLEVNHRLSQGKGVSTCELWHFAVIQLVPPWPSIASGTLRVSYTRSSSELSLSYQESTPT